ncbi:MAG TPA: ATP-binding protein [Kofleriaceae bacterium]|nr:ATP-binding protein [Kofleriaceae bacterium]
MIAAPGPDPGLGTGERAGHRASAATWHAANQRYLAAATTIVRALIDARAAADGAPDGPGDGAPDGAALADRHAAARRELEDAARAMPAESALDALCTTLRLSPFERDLLVLCAAVELDSTFAAACARAQGDSRRAYPTFSLALGALPHAHWSALSPAAPLRRFQLIALGQADTLTMSPLRIDERVLHYLAGVHHVDERLLGLVDLVREAGALPPSHHELADRIARVWSRAGAAMPIVQLVGPDDEARRRIAAAACAAVNATLYALPASALSASGTGLDEPTLARLFTREAVLGGSALVIECDDLEPSDPRALAAVRLADRTGGLVLVTSRDRRRLGRRPAITFEVRHPPKPEQRALWGEWIAATALAPPDAARQTTGHATERVAEHVAGRGSDRVADRVADRVIDRLVAQFDLGAPGIELACAIAAEQPSGDPATALWNACRHESRPRLDDLAQRIEPAARWDDLVLPDAHREVLREIAVHVRQRDHVYGRWGFAGQGGRGLGISALFSGASGTGKTMAAEVLAHELALDLYRVDLSQTISKYIGETEKNLRRIFDAADGGATILLFDEADALFGKRSEVKDSHDRFANIEVSYLLQRMEAYRGLAILTTNLKSALDPAFLRRLRFVVPFQFPSAAQREEIWRRVFPPETPTHGLDLEKLSRMNIAGGNIRNIAVGAAFLAAEAGEPVRMAHVLRAAEREYGKLERPLNRAELD